MKTIGLKPTRQSPEQVLVGALEQLDTSAVTERALPGFKKRLWLFVKVGSEGGAS